MITCKVLKPMAQSCVLFVSIWAMAKIYKLSWEGHVCTNVRIVGTARREKKDKGLGTEIAVMLCCLKKN